MREIKFDNIGMMLRSLFYNWDDSKLTDAYLVHDNCHISKLTLLLRDVENKYLDHHGNVVMKNNLQVLWTNDLKKCLEAEFRN